MLRIFLCLAIGAPQHFILFFFEGINISILKPEVSMLGNISMLVSLRFYARVLMSLCLKIFYMIVSLCFYALANL